MKDTKVDTKRLKDGMDYAARGIIARIQPIGHYEHGPFQRAPFYRFLTMDAGKGHDKFAVEFYKKARIDKDGTLDMSELKEGMIVVSPGFIYKKIPWTDALLVEHFKALKVYRPQTIIKSDVDRDAPVTDLGAINAPPGTKQ